MKFYPNKDYAEHLETYRILAHGTPEEKAEALNRQRAQLTRFRLPEQVAAEERIISGPEVGQTLRLRVIHPADPPSALPVILDIHGGGWVSGGVEIDDFRNTLLALGASAAVVSVEYRLAPAHPFPAALLDCYTALCWLGMHASEIGADPARIALHGTSAGGNLAAGLSLYVRDHGGPRIALAALVCPALTLENTVSRGQMERYALGDASDWAHLAERLYLGKLDGSAPSYYAFPSYSPTLCALPPTAIVAAEYDPLRDEALAYASRLLREGVPCELILAPRVGHAYTAVDGALTRRTYESLCASFQREFERA